MEEKRITLRPVLIVYSVSSASTDRVNLAYCFVKVCIDAILLQGQYLDFKKTPSKLNGKGFNFWQKRNAVADCLVFIHVDCFLR